VVQRLGFLGGKGQHFFNARRVGNIPNHLLVGACADLFFDFHPDGFQVEPQFLQDVDGDALSELNEAQEQMFGTDKIMVEAVGFLARQRQHLLSAGRKIVHGFVAHTHL
jgi:hypothetical protein